MKKQCLKEKWEQDGYLDFIKEWVASGQWSTQLLFWLILYKGSDKDLSKTPFQEAMDYVRGTSNKPPRKGLTS